MMDRMLLCFVALVSPGPPLRFIVWLFIIVLPLLELFLISAIPRKFLIVFYTLLAVQYISLEPTPKLQVSVASSSLTSALEES